MRFVVRAKLRVLVGLVLTAPLTLFVLEAAGRRNP